MVVSRPTTKAALMPSWIWIIELFSVTSHGVSYLITSTCAGLTDFLTRVRFTVSEPYPQFDGLGGIMVNVQERLGGIHERGYRVYDALRRQRPGAEELCDCP